MSYLHIENLWRPAAKRILEMRRGYALEKVHGTSAHVRFNRVLNVGPAMITFAAGGESHVRFVGLFDQEALKKRFDEIGHREMTVYGEAYGGSQQGMSATYGKELAFIAFDVKVDETWLAVPDAVQIVTALGLEFVPYELVDLTLEALDRERDRPSVVAARRGMGEDKIREGIVIRPIFEVMLAGNERLIAKHKCDAFAERATPPKVMDAEQAKVLADAEAIAQEWVSPMRLSHVLSKLPDATDLRAIPLVIKAMVEDVYREAKGEIVESKAATQAIGKRAAALFKARITSV